MDVSDIFLAVSPGASCRLPSAVCQLVNPLSCQIVRQMRQLRQRGRFGTGVRRLCLRLDVSQQESSGLMDIRYFRHYLNLFILWSVWNQFELIPWVCCSSNSNVWLSH
jgi:hypothetical protein